MSQLKSKAVKFSKLSLKKTEPKMSISEPIAPVQHHQNNISKYFTNAMNDESISNKPSSKHKISALNVDADHEPKMKRNRAVDKNNDFNLNMFSNQEATKRRMKKDKNLVTDYFENNLSDEDFVSPEKRIKFPKLPIKKVVPKKKSRKKQPDIRKLLQNNEEKIFDDLISQHSQNDEVCPEQIQLALALSKSLVDQEQPFQSEIDLPCTSSNEMQSKEKRFELMKSTLEQYGFKCKTSYYDYNIFQTFGNKKTTSRKKKGTRKATLLERIDNEQQQLHNERIKLILSNRRIEKPIKICCEPSYEISSDYLKQFESTKKWIYHVNSNEELSPDNAELYYCMESIERSNVKLGCLLRNWNDIPGREIDLNLIYEYNSNSLCEEVSENQKNLNTETIAAINILESFEQSVDSTPLESLDKKASEIDSPSKIVPYLTECEVSNKTLNSKFNNSVDDLFADCDIEECEIFTSDEEENVNEENLNQENVIIEETDEENDENEPKRSLLKDNFTEDNFQDNVRSTSNSSTNTPVGPENSDTIIELSSDSSNSDDENQNCHPQLLDMNVSYINSKYFEDLIDGDNYNNSNIIGETNSNNTHKSDESVKSHKNVNECLNEELSPEDKSFTDKNDDANTVENIYECCDFEINVPQDCLELSDIIKVSQIRDFLELRLKTKDVITALCTESNKISTFERTMDPNFLKTDIKVTTILNSLEIYGNDELIQTEELLYILEQLFETQSQLTEFGDYKYIKIFEILIFLDKCKGEKNKQTYSELQRAQSENSNLDSSDVIVLSDDELNYSFGVQKFFEEYDNKPAKQQSNTIIEHDTDESSDNETDCSESEQMLNLSVARILEESKTQHENDNTVLYFNDSPYCNFKSVQESTPKLSKNLINKTRSFDDTPSRRSSAFNDCYNKKLEEAKNKKYSSNENLFNQNITETPVRLFDDFDRIVHDNLLLNKRPVEKTQAGLCVNTLSKSVQRILEDSILNDNNDTSFQILNEDCEIRTSNITPKPLYKNMSIAEIHGHLNEFGIKPLKRQAAILVLDLIYEQTHPYHTTNEKGDIYEVLTPLKSHPQKNLRKTSLMANLEKKYGLSQTKTSVVEETKQWKNKNSVIVKSDQNTKRGNRKINLQVISVDENACLSSENPCLLELEDDIYFFPSKGSVKVSTCAIPFHIAFYNLVKSDAALRNSILKYQPINLDGIYKYFKEMGVRYEPNDIIVFLDKRCIAFHSESQSSARNKKYKKITPSQVL